MVLLTAAYSAGEAPPGEQPLPRLLDPTARPWSSFLENEGDEISGPSWCHLFASDRDWSPGVFDPIFRQVADDEIRNVMVVDPACRWLFHPYDGGVDVILDSPPARDRLRATHPDWLSARPDGL